MKKSTLKRTAVSGLMAILSLVGCSTKPSLYFQSGIASDYVVLHGGMKKGTVNQSLVNLDFNNGFSGFVWQNFDFAENKVNEIDLYAQYKKPINSDLSVRVAFQRFFYPSGEFGNYDNAIRAGAHYSNAFDLDLDITQLIAHDEVPDGTRYYLQASKTFPIIKTNNTKLSLTPSISTAFIDNFYRSTGFSQITPGLNLKLTKGKTDFNLFVNQQEGKRGFEDETIYGAFVGYSF